MSNLTQNTKLEELQKRISALESGEAPKIMVNTSPYNTPPAPVKKPEIMKPEAPKSVPKPQPAQVSKPTVTEEEVLAEPVPMSKPANPNSLKALWANLLENVSSFPSRAILKQQAVPVKITQNEVIITIKNSNWLKQFGPEGSKHSFIVDASNSLFGSAVKKIIVRAPESGDEAIRKEQTAGDEDDKPAPVPKSVPQPKPEVKKEEIVEAVEAKEEIDSQDDVGEPSQTVKRKSSDSSFHSDNVNMVMELFDGKFID